MTDTMFDHRISRAVAAMQIRVESLDSEARAAFDANATMDAGDMFAFGELPSRALMAGVLTADEAQYLHAIHTTFESESPAKRAVFLLTMGELLKAGV